MPYAGEKTLCGAPFSNNIWSAKQRSLESRSLIRAFPLLTSHSWNVGAWLGHFKCLLTPRVMIALWYLQVNQHRDDVTACYPEQNGNVPLCLDGSKHSLQGREDIFEGWVQSFPLPERTCKWAFSHVWVLYPFVCTPERHTLLSKLYHCPSRFATVEQGRHREVETEAGTPGKGINSQDKGLVTCFYVTA